ncbi:ArsR/SmtB family transcription factor [Bradyrhizobium guangdongense]|uniref:Transcriptional regulator n=1 Tax=Bradyrhizobium guangdongense TaxID=1325090 RepID=A0A410V2S5_9BRAD|nr:metalloregulator ArsR/SmtB family transcription factor [Bradyrhizobium guangdongense]QAU37948.1 transcriptional regulator [Bradyrhizobium guangdongense]QOZ59005.1 transcriptional regulator [Bradyrhizobium guangdongense]GGI19213.1 transcriptional regulator [Bradyrhizobium guangdongense]
MGAARQSVHSGFSRLTDALSDPAREAMVSALFGGKALPAGELALLAGVSPQSASAHLQKLTEARLLSVWQQGRFRYYRIADDEVAGLIENLVNVAARTEHAERARGVPMPLRQSRTCYCHLAGQLGVALRHGLLARKLIALRGREAFITDEGLAWCRAEAVDFKPGRDAPLRLCNDWTERVPHLAGPFANAILKRLIATHALAPHRVPRALRLTPRGRAFFERLGVSIPF